MFQFIESIKVDDGQIHLPEEHQKRIDKVFINFGKANPLSIQEVVKEINFPQKGLFKLRIEYDLESRFIVELLPYNRRRIQKFQMVTHDDLDYRFKYKNRKIFDEIKAHSSAEEIIIIQKRSITDTSFSNIVFRRNHEWWTPKTYLLNGVQRQWLLNNNKIKECDITLDNLSDFTHFKLINAMNNLEEAITYHTESITG